MKVSILIAVAAVFALASLWRVLPLRNGARDTLADAAPPVGERVDVELGALVRDALGNNTGSLAPLRVTVCPAQIRILLEHLCALAQSAAPRWLLRVDGPHAVLHLVGEEMRGGTLPLTALFGGRRPAAGPLRERITQCEQIVSQHSGRIYAAPSPLGPLTLTVRLPLRAASGSAPSFIVV